MARQSGKVPTEVELEILKTLWERGPLAGNQIAVSLQPNRNVTYQAVMTMLSIMEHKGYVTRRKVDGRYVYRARVTEKATTRRMLQEIVRKVFGGSTSAAVLNLLEASELTDAELDELRQTIDSQRPGRLK